MTDRRTGIVVVNYGSHALLEQSLLPLDLEALGAVVVVVDNFSTVTERSAVTALSERFGWHLVTVNGNPGFGAGVNLGVAQAKSLGCTTYLLLNPDARAEDAVVTALVAHVDREPRDLVSPRVLRPDGSTWFAGGDLDLVSGRTTGVRPGRPRVGVPWLTGACLVAHDDLWTELGGFDESMFMYWEDVELSYRCLRVGGGLIVRDDLTVVHDVGGTQDGEDKSALYFYWNSRNRLAFAALHLTPQQCRRWLWATPAYTWALLRRGRGRRRVLTELGPVAAALRGVLAGVRVMADAGEPRRWPWPHRPEERPTGQPSVSPSGPRQ